MLKYSFPHFAFNKETEDADLTFLPAGRRKAARKLLCQLVAHPAIHVRRGELLLGQKKLGHPVLLLDFVLGTGLSTIRHQKDFVRLLHDLGWKGKIQGLERKKPVVVPSGPRKKKKKMAKKVKEKSTPQIKPLPQLNQDVIKHLR